MYQQIQGLNTEEKGIGIRYENAKSIQQNVRFDRMSNNFRKYPKTKARKI
jgi:hypothetical protein